MLLEDYFLGTSTETELRDGNLEVKGNDLLRNNGIIARKIDADNFFIARNVGDINLNDKILEILFKNDKKFTRIGDFASELGRGALITALENGDYAKAQQLAPLHEIALDDTTVAEMKAAREAADKAEAEANRVIEEARKQAAEISEKAQAEAQQAKQAASKIISAIRNTFAERQAEEDRIKRQEAEAKLTESQKATLAAWDRGEGARYNDDVTAANGHIVRLRTKVSRSGNKRMETSSDYQVTYRTALRAWRLAASLWFGGNRLPSFTAGTYTVYADDRSVHVGCQSVRKSEILRYAEAESWPIEIEAIDALIAEYPARR